MANESSIRKAINVVNIEGVLKENNLKLHTTKDGKDMIMGEVVVQTGEKSFQTVKMMASRLKRDGTENGLYKGLETVMNDYKSIASVGEEEADRVRITSGTLGINEYYNQKDELVIVQQVSTNFINRLQPEDEMTPKAEFEAEVFITAVKEEVKGGESTGRLVISTLIPQFGGSITPFNFIVDDEELIGAVESAYAKGDTVRIFGEIISTVETKVENVGTAIGKGREKITKTTIKEFRFTSGDLPYEEDNQNRYTVDQIKKALAEREDHLQNLKKKKSEAGKSTGTNANKGTGIKKSAPPAPAQKPVEKKVVKAPTVDDDDLPF